MNDIPDDVDEDPEELRFSIEPGASIGQLTIRNTDSKIFEITQQPIDLSLTFFDDGEQVGKFEYDRETRVWNFEGQLAGTAKIFARSMYLQFEYLLQDEIDKRAHLIAEANIETDDDQDPNYCAHCGARYYEKHAPDCPLNG